MKDSIFYLLLTIIFIICMMMFSFSAGEDKGHKDAYKGKVECVEVFNKIECRLNPNNS